MKVNILCTRHYIYDTNLAFVLKKNVMNAFSCFYLYEQGGATAFYIAAQEGHVSALQLLLDKGAAIETKRNVSQTGYGAYKFISIIKLTNSCIFVCVYMYL